MVFGVSLARNHANDRVYAGSMHHVFKFHVRCAFTSLTLEAPLKCEEGPGSL